MPLPARLILLLAVALPLSAVAAPGPKKVRIAVTEIRALGSDPQQAELLTEITTSEVANLGRFDVISSSDVAGMLGFEKQKALLGCKDDTSCLAEIAGGLGADFVLFGTMGKLGNLFRVDLRLMDARRGKVAGRVGRSVSGAEENLVAAVHELVPELFGKIGAPAVASSPPPEKVEQKPDAAPEKTEKPEVRVATAAPLPTIVSEPPPAEPPAAPSPGMSGKRLAGLVVGGVGAAALVGGGVTGVLAWQSYSAEQAASDAKDKPAYDQNKTDAKSRALVADVLYGTAAVGLGVGAFLYFTGGPSTAAATPTVNVGMSPAGASVTMAGSF